MEQQKRGYTKSITVTDGPSKGICAIPRSQTNPNVFKFAFTFAANGQKSRKTINFEVTSHEVCGGFEIKGVTEDGIKVEGMYCPPDFDYIFFGKKSVARNGSFISYSQFNPF